MVMTYTIAKEFKIINDEDGWSFKFSVDEYGTVRVYDSNSVTSQTIHIPKDCIQHFIDVLEQYK
jgi:hypothetical protein